MDFDLDLTFYWCDLEERENPVTARGIYQQLAKMHPTYEVHERWLQFELREKQVGNAKVIYDNLLNIYAEDMEVLSYVLVRYSDFALKHYKDLESARKLLKSYMDHLPFNQHLLCKYLELMRQFNHTEGYY